MTKRSFALLPLAKPGPQFTYRDFDHTPENKRAGQVKSIGSLVVQDYDGSKVNPDAWTTVEVSELTTTDSGRVQRRAISISLDAAGRKALIDMLADRAR